MRLDCVDRDLIHITLSERNLRALLAMLHGHPPESEVTINIQYFPGLVLAVHAEPDAVHYKGRRSPGLMHPATEEAIRRRGWDDAT